jgi:V/A-type H+-transporting ATPase subunit F
MKQIAVIGSPQFTLGFRLAGVRRVVDVSGQAGTLFRELQSDDRVGIIVTSTDCFAQLNEDLREALAKAIRPVTVVIGGEDRGEMLQKMVKRSIGIEL